MTSILVVIACIALLFIVLAIYPGELSWLSPTLHARLYDSAARTYEEKWLRHDYSSYDELLRRSCSLVTETHKERLSVLDLCAGTGRATEVMSSVLPTDTQFVCVDLSPAMLRALETRLAKTALEPKQAQIVCDSAEHWLNQTSERFHMVAMMECSEFLPRFPMLLRRLTKHLIPGAVIVTTRPAGPLGWLFPCRAQHRKSYYKLFKTLGFSLVSDEPWRNRYRLIVWQFHRH